MTSTIFVVALGALGLLASVIVPFLPMLLALVPDALFNGEVWRLFTWPLADQISLWSLLTLVLLWYFGTALESQVGRAPMARLYLWCWGALTISTVLVGVVARGSVAALGMNTIELFILLLWIAEYPTRRFFFNIPAWVIGAVLLGLQVLQMLAARAWGGLFSLLIALVIVALAAKRVGLLGTYSWIPGSQQRTRRRRTRHRAPTRTEKRHTSDEQRLDDLLGKISANGLHSLTKSERAELEKLRLRRRR
ncbi:hypothetical protein FOJ82_06290 [Tessaracoccus rhinocerotis]|uniref:DUF6576 domain-containing protein n=1 Tax=Tessaracoccus rhinocerotis TaxID=1689449 RepID=A0A553K1Z4_9ACTN|nr:DUF6576 domain-containing protein [Tessaracoccus rhinocerotis]TRY18721.1 hypothetical protein FOJ82_06290 [Tessaracoccus rhinocerotis]